MDKQDDGGWTGISIRGLLGVRGSSRIGVPVMTLLSVSS